MKYSGFLSSFKNVLVGSCLLVMISVCVGISVNRLRVQPLPLTYATPQQRIEQDLIRVADASAAASPESSRKPSAKDAAELSGAEKEQYQAYLDAVKKRPDEAFNLAVGVWKGTGSAELQRAVIAKAMKKVTSSDDSESLQVMLQALDDPRAQWQECDRLSRGNGLEKLISSQRTALLEGNPGVRAAKATASPSVSFASADHPQVISWQEFRSIVEAKEGVILDARPRKIYRLGHVPGALNVSREEFAADYAIQKALLESDKGRLIAVYCEGLDCEDSQMVAGALVKLGYRRVLLFKGGWTEWTFQHLPREAQH